MKSHARNRMGQAIRGAMLLAHAQLTAARDNEGAIIKGQCIREGNKKTLPTPPSEKKDVDFGFFFLF
jgi:hypothetical protein